MKNLITRTIAGAIFIATIIIPLLWVEWLFVLILGVYALLAYYEYLKLTGNKKIKSDMIIPIFMGAFLYIVFILFYFKIVTTGFFILLIPLVLIPIIIAIFSDDKNAFGKGITIITGLLLTILPAGLLTIPLNLESADDGQGGGIIILGVFVLTWTHDTFAYLTGKFFGKRALYKSISPAKTIEGSVGGLIFTFAVAWLFAFISHSLNPLFWIVTAFIVAVAGTFGDLLESKLKRLAQVKDSGNIIPGHGGVYDRFDAILMISPFWFVWLFLFLMLIY